MLVCVIDVVLLVRVLVVVVTFVFVMCGHVGKAKAILDSAMEAM